MLVDYPETENKPIRYSTDGDYRGPDVRDLIKEIQRQVEEIGPFSACPVRARKHPHNGMDVWVSHHPYLHINVVLPTVH